MTIMMTTPTGLRILSEPMMKGDDGRWVATSPEGRWFIRNFYFHEPSADALVTGIWLGAGKENELACPVNAATLNDLFAQPSGLWWSDPELNPRAVVSVQMEGTARQIAVCFTSSSPDRLGYGCFTSKDSSA